MSKPTGFLIFLFIGGLLVFAATQLISGTVKPESALSIFSLNSPLKVPVTVKNPQVGKLPTVGQNGETYAGTSTGMQQPGVKPPIGWTAEQLSPYYGQVKISNVRSARAAGEESGFRLGAVSSIREPLTVTGWHVKSNKSDTLIPDAISDYVPFGIPVSVPIALPANGSVTVSSRESPIKENLRMNSCIGYLNERYSFSPVLPSSCPKPYAQREEVAAFPGDCQTFILSMISCHAPTTNEVSKFSGYSYQACRAFLERFTYASCYTRERAKSSFFSNEWRVWANVYIPFDSNHDRVLLLDTSGLLVDQYVY